MESIPTPRLILRPLERGDLRPLHRLYRDPELMRYITGKPRTLQETVDKLEVHLRDYERYGFGLYATILRESGKMVGRAGLVPTPGEEGLEAELAWLVRQDQQGKGLAFEMGAALVDHAFSRLTVRRLFAKAYVENEPSIRVMEKLGMHHVLTADGEVLYELKPH